MEKRIKKPAGLTALFWRYLLTTGAVIILLAILWWFWMIVMMRNGIVYPANTAANGVETVVQALSAGELDTADIPYFYRWAIFDDRGEVLSDGKMDQRHLDYAKAALAGEPDPQGMFYSQYHRLTQMPDGTTCVIQYDYSMPYGSEVLQGRLPEFQTCAAIILLLSWLAAGAISTHHFAGLLRRDAALLTGATETIAQQRLDTPLSGKARVREFGETLTAMEQMRLSLAQSLERQWAMEQQRRLELAALTHDLKTPLTVISGNAELLAEDSLPAAQEEMVNTILHSAIRLQDYVAQLRAMTAEGAEADQKKETADLADLVCGWRGIGQSLCSAKQIRFQCPSVPKLELSVYRTSLDRAVSNLLDNAVRYTPVGGQITLTAFREGDRLTIAVEDSGPGFSLEALARGEQAFFTSDASRPQEGHMGMGLYFAGQAAKRHGGSLRLANTEQGARAELVLPIN